MTCDNNFDNESDNAREMADLEVYSTGVVDRGGVSEYMQGNPRESMLMQNRSSFVSGTQNSFIMS